MLFAKAKHEQGEPLFTHFEKGIFTCVSSPAPAWQDMGCTAVSVVMRRVQSSRLRHRDRTHAAGDSGQPYLSDTVEDLALRETQHDQGMGGEHQAGLE
jgi:hypothetical protein